MKYFFVFLLFLSSCGFSPVSDLNKEEKEVFISYDDTLLNNRFVSEIKRKQAFLNLKLSNSKDAKINIEILNHKILRYSGSRDRDFFSATGNIEYEISMKISKLNKSKNFNFSSSQTFPYDINKILSNEEKTDEIEEMFFLGAQTQLINFLNLYFNE